MLGRRVFLRLRVGSQLACSVGSLGRSVAFKKVRDRQAERQDRTDRTDRQTDPQTDRQEGSFRHNSLKANICAYLNTVLKIDLNYMNLMFS